MRFMSLCVAAVAVAALLASSVNAGTITGPVTFTDDAGSGISSAKTYTHLIDPGDGAAATVNGVTFNAVAGRTSMYEADFSSTLGFKYTEAAVYGNGSGVQFLDGVRAAGTGVPTGSGADTLLVDFMYSGGESVYTALTLSSPASGTQLTPGLVYEARLYYRSWDPPNLQNLTVTFNENGAGALGSSIALNESEASPSEARYLAYRYTATSSPLTIVMTNTVANASWHLYGLSNELVSVPEPSMAMLLFAGLTGLLAYAWRKQK
jgi:hypothetical protein